MKGMIVAVSVAAMFAVSTLTMTAGADPVTTGDWTLYPEQSSSTEVVESVGTAYRTLVRPPINANGSSNWKARRGVVPVQFDLQTATKTTTTTTTTYGPVVFESIGSDSDGANDYSFLSLNPDPEITFDDLSNLSTDYVFNEGNCGGGSLRWQVRIDANGNGERDNYVQATSSTPASGDPALFIYYGTYPNFTDCTTVNQSGVNMLSLNDLRFDTSQFNYHVDFGSVSGTGTFYDSYANASALFGGRQVIAASLVLDSGWLSDQDVSIAETTVNDNTFVPKTTEVDVQVEVGPFAPTCNLPVAGIDVVKNDSNPDGAVNEVPQSVQIKDDGTTFRRVDCKYIYNLDISSLSGAGTYRVYADIDGRVKEWPAQFDLI